MTTSFNNGSKRSGKKNSKKRPTRRNRDDTVVRYVHRGRFVADRSFVKLVWNDTTLTRSSAASSNVMNFAIRSSAYDPDPAALTGAIPGFVELSNLYTGYRVRYMKARWTVSNAQVNGIVIACWPSTTIINVNSLTAADVYEYAGNVGGKIVSIGNNNTPPKTVNTTATSRSLFGPFSLIDTTFASSTSTNPSVMYGVNFGVVAPFANFDYPVGSQLSVEYGIEFFERRQLET